MNQTAKIQPASGQSIIKQKQQISTTGFINYTSKNYNLDN
jgi:hypothetical protein